MPRPATEGGPVPHDLFVCPRCGGGLALTVAAYDCLACGRRYPINGDIPVLVENTASIEHDELDHIASHGVQHGQSAKNAHNDAQSAWFDRETLSEFEIERPMGSPAFYQFLLGEKFRRSVQPFGGRLDGWTALTVCGGSGMDAEFLARAGAAVISSDISIGAASRARQRAERHRVPIVPIVADAEHLPFADRSMDLVYVHDGLHHLEDPWAGLAEMARVARRAVAINEPAQARATAIAVRLGLALEREDAGNRVARLEPSDVTVALRAAGFNHVRAERYAMYYAHVPGRLMRVLSWKPLRAVAVAGWRLTNRALGRVGNKLTVVGMR